MRCLQNILDLFCMRRGKEGGTVHTLGLCGGLNSVLHRDLLVFAFSFQVYAFFDHQFHNDLLICWDYISIIYENSFFVSAIYAQRGIKF